MIDNTFSSLGINNIDLNRSGEQYSTCPKCSPSRKHKSNRCLSVNVEKGLFKCHQCGRYGTLAKGWSDDPAWSAKREYLLPDSVGMDPRMPEPIQHWFLSRKITMAAVTALGISFHPQIYFQELKGLGPAICFPFYRDGVMTNVKYRGNNKMFRLEAGAERILYNMPGCYREVERTSEDATGRVTVRTEKEQWSWCVIVEGEMDCLAITTAGIPNVVSVPDGAPDVKAKNYTAKFDFLTSCEDFLSGFSEIIIAVDRDEPGQVLEAELGRRLGSARCKRVVWPDGCKDANDVLMKYGRDYLQDYILNNATEFPVSGVFTVAMLSDRIELFYDNGLPRGHPSGIESLDKCYRPAPGHLVVLTGVSWSGKSTFWDWYMMQFAKSYGWHSVICSPENVPLELHMSKMITRYANQPFELGPTPRMSKSELRNAMDFVNEHFTWILPDEDDFTLAKILEKMDAVVARKGARMAIIDPWNEIDHMQASGQTETNYISKSLTDVRKFARSHGVEFTMTVHPTKLAKDYRTGKRPKKPTLEDAAGSNAWRNKADVGIIVSREDDITEIEFAKVRFEERGQKGTVKMKYDLVTKNFSPLDVADELKYAVNDGQLSVSRPVEGGF